MSYDKRHDVLYVAFEETDTPSDYLELESGDILRIDPATKAVLGCTIMDFAKRVGKGLDVPAIGELSIDRDAVAR